MTQPCSNKSAVGQEASGEKFWFVAFTHFCYVNTFDGSQNSWLYNNKLSKLQHNHCDLEVGACHLWLSGRRIFLVNCTSFWVPHDKRPRESVEGGAINWEDDKMISSWSLWSGEERASLFTCSHGLGSSAAKRRPANKVSCMLSWIPLLNHSWRVAGKAAAWICRERSYFPPLECLTLNQTKCILRQNGMQQTSASCQILRLYITLHKSCWTGCDGCLTDGGSHSVW